MRPDLTTDNPSTVSSPTINRQLARYVNRLSLSSLPSLTIERTKNCILDALAVGIAGRLLPVPLVALDLVKGNKGPCTIYGHSEKVPILDAVFVNATLINGRSQDDFLLKSHPGALTISAALAVAEEHQNSGDEIISSLVAGYDIVGRIFLGGPSMLPRFRASGVAGTIGAAATAGKLLQFSEDQLKDALGCAAVFSSGFGEGFLAGTMEVKLNVGMAARSGVTAALLVHKGADAAESTLEGKSGFYQAFANTSANASAVTSDLGKRFLIDEVIYKEYPACIFVQTPIYLADRLKKENHINPDGIGRVILRVTEPTINNPGFKNCGPFTTHLQAAVSGRFCAASALLGRPVNTYEHYDYYKDSEILKLAERIDLVEDNMCEGQVTMEVEMRDGTRYVLKGVEGETLRPTTSTL